ncbi:MAG: GntR family transcriptional regulator [Planctomycetia bacterium]|nr:GntR family transcriptional regulator [Planctomycetia bacterium]
MESLLSQRVYDQLYEAMLDSRLRPGDRLNRRQVAADLGVSVAPVLEAMTQLEWEGFLETSPRLGTVVRHVQLDDVLGKFRLRQAIEVEAARVSAGERIRAARAAIEPLATKADLAESATAANFRTEVDFHRAVLEAAACPQLSKAFENVMRHGLYHAAQNLLPHLPQRTTDIHRKLLAALCRADANAAERLIRRHLEPWFAAISAAAVPPAHETVAFRGPAVSLKQRRPRVGKTK